MLFRNTAINGDNSYNNSKKESTAWDNINDVKRYFLIDYSFKNR